MGVRMSLPVKHIECTKCDFKHPTPKPTTRVYKYQDELVHIPWVRAWCFDCKDVVVAESLETDPINIKDVKKLLNDIASQKLLYDGVIPKTNYGYIDRVKKVKISVDDAFQLSKIVFDLNHIEFKVRSFYESLQISNIINQRSSQARCLHCGSNNFERLNIQNKEDLSEHTSSQHPQCGGYLFWEESGLRIAWNFNASPVKIYDTEGNYITSESP